MTTENTNNSPAEFTPGSAVVELSLTGAGAVVWWEFVDTRITPERLRKVLGEHGDATVVNDINQRNAVVRAAREWRRRTHRAEVAFEDANEIVIGILHRENPKAKEVAWKQIDKVVFDLSSGKWSDVGSTDEAAKYIAHADTLRGFLDHQWLRPWIQGRFEKMAALSLRKRSAGFHFVGNQFFADVEKLAAIVSKIGSCSLNVMPVTQSAATQAAVAQAATSSTKESLASLRDRLDSWKQSARRVSSSSAENVLAAFAELKDRCDLYSDAMSISLSDLQDEIKVASDEARKIIDDSGTTAKDENPVDLTGSKTGMHWAHRRQIERVSKIIGGRERTAEFTATADDIVAAGFGKSAGYTPLFWNRVQSMGCGAAAAYLGWSTKATMTDGAMTVAFTPLADWTEPEQDAPVEAEAAPSATPDAPDAPDAPEIVETTVEVDERSLEDDIADARADMREQLANLHVKDVRVRYDQVFGNGGHTGVKKDSMITKLVDALA